jgi:hypothetical protein
MRYVVLFHQMPAQTDRGDHWDFMLEVDGRLRTWALDAEPLVGQCSLASALDDHRLEYLTYEGPISGGRGNVTRWDAGTYETLRASAELWRLRLAGARLQCDVRLEQVSPQRWTVSFGGRAIDG